MYGGYDLPPWACDEDAEDYECCANNTDCFVLRMVKTYESLVQQRYRTTPSFKRTSFLSSTPRHQQSKYADRVYALAEELQKAGVEDPEPFIAYLFEMWIASGGHDKFIGKTMYSRSRGGGAKKVELSSSPGFGYPSWRFIGEDGPEFIEGFLSILSRGYKPSQFITSGNLEDLSPGKYLDEKVAEWANAHDTTEEEYWRRPGHWHYPFLTLKSARGSQSLRRCARAIRELVIESGHPEYQNVSDEDVYNELLLTIQAAEEAKGREVTRLMEEHKKARELGLQPTYRNLEFLDPDYELCSEVDRGRILAYKDAIQEGKSVEDPKVQREIEDRVNPLDRENPDTIMYVLYGKGAPRRLDGSVYETD